MQLLLQNKDVMSKHLEFIFKKLIAIEDCEITVQSDKFMKSKFLTIESYLSTNMDEFTDSGK